MNPRLSQPQASPTRNPVARSLALAVLGVALLGAAIMGAIGFALLLCVSAIGYVASLAHSSWRRFRPRRRAALAVEPAAAPAKAGSIEGELEAVAAAANVASRGASGSA
jgi:predicted lipid-binding transport protein (Tim44 family)